MTNNQNQPREFDAVRGGETPPPIQGAVLGGLEGVKQRLASSVFEARVAALSEALNYGEIGFNLVIQSLRDDSLLARQFLCKTLISKIKPQVHKGLHTYSLWLERINETIDEAYIYYPFKQFYNRQVENFNPRVGITNPAGKAYVIDDESFTDLFQETLASEIEALIIRGYDDEPRISSQSVFKSLKAIFFGPYDVDYQISWTLVTNISLILKAYPNLELLQVRGGDGYYEAPNRYWEDFICLRHESLKALIIETGGLCREKITQILSLELHALEHLELWLGTDEYGGNSSIDDLMPILSGTLFPNLRYLGLRNSEYSDDIANIIVNSPIINQLKVLDLSMGTLGDKGAEALLNCPAVDNLTFLNVSNSCLTEEMVERLKQSNVEVITETRKYPEDRYCSISE